MKRRIESGFSLASSAPGSQWRGGRGRVRGGGWPKEKGSWHDKGLAELLSLRHGMEAAICTSQMHHDHGMRRTPWFTANNDGSKHAHDGRDWPVRRATAEHGASSKANVACGVPPLRLWQLEL